MFKIIYEELFEEEDCEFAFLFELNDNIIRKSIKKYKCFINTIINITKRIYVL